MFFIKIYVLNICIFLLKNGQKTTLKKGQFFINFYEKNWKKIEKNDKKWLFFIFL